jgi:hypothetical protein
MVQAVVQSLWWQAHSKDTKKAAQASFQVCTLRPTVFSPCLTTLQA